MEVTVLVEVEVGGGEGPQAGLGGHQGGGREGQKGAGREGRTHLAVGGVWGGVDPVLGRRVSQVNGLYDPSRRRGKGGKGAKLIAKRRCGTCVGQVTKAFPVHRYVICYGRGADAKK